MSKKRKTYSQKSVPQKMWQKLYQAVFDQDYSDINDYLLKVPSGEFNKNHRKFLDELCKKIKGIDKSDHRKTLFASLFQQFGELAETHSLPFNYLAQEEGFSTVHFLSEALILHPETRIGDDKFPEFIRVHRKLNHAPSHQVQKEWFKSAQKSIQQGKYGQDSLVKCIGSCASLRLPIPQEFMNAWFEAATATAFNGLDHSYIAFSLASLKAQKVNLPKKLTQHLLQPTPKLEIEASNGENASYSNRLFIAKSMFPDLIEGDYKFRTNKHSQSKMHRNFSRILLKEAMKATQASQSGLSYEVTKEVKLPAIGSPVDNLLSVHIKNSNQISTKFYIQIDGPSHEVIMPDQSIQLGGNSLLQQAVAQEALKDEKDKFIRISHQEIMPREKLDNISVARKMEQKASELISELRDVHLGRDLDTGYAMIVGGR